MVKFFKQLKSFDLFAETPSLTLFHKKKYPTYTGFFLSIFLFSLIALFSFSKFQSVINRINPSIESEEKLNFNTPTLDLRYKFAFFVSPEYMNALSGKRYFDFYYSIRVNTILKNGTKNNTIQDLNLVACKSSHFPNFDQKDFDTFGMGKWMCPNFTNLNLDFKLKGSYGEEIYKFIEIGIKKCSNGTNLGQNDTCANETEFEALKKAGTKYYFNLIMINNLINIDNYEKPFSPYVESLQTLFNVGNTYIQKEYYFNYAEIETDFTQSMNFLRTDSNIIKENSFYFDGKVDDFKIDDIQYRLKQQVHASIFLRSSKKSKSFFRKYSTFQDVLQTAGSFYSIFFLIFSLINSRLIKKEKIEKLACALYNFNSNDSQKQSSSEHNNNKKLSCFCFFSKVFNKFFSCFKRKKSKLGLYSVKDVEDELSNDLDIINILMSLRKMENFERAISNDEQFLLLQITGKNDFEKRKPQKKIVPLNQKKDPGKNLSLKSCNPDKKAMIEQAFKRLQEDKENRTSMKICHLVKNYFNSNENLTSLMKMKFNLRKF